MERKLIPDLSILETGKRREGRMLNWALFSPTQKGQTVIRVKSGFFFRESFVYRLFFRQYKKLWILATNV